MHPMHTGENCAGPCDGFCITVARDHVTKQSSICHPLGNQRGKCLRLADYGLISSPAREATEPSQPMANPEPSGLSCLPQLREDSAHTLPSEHLHPRLRVSGPRDLVTVGVEGLRERRKASVSSISVLPAGRYGNALAVRETICATVPDVGFGGGQRLQTCGNACHKNPDRELKAPYTGSPVLCKWLASTTVLMYKKEEPTYPRNYHPLTVSSAIYTVYRRLLLQNISIRTIL